MTKFKKQASVSSIDELIKICELGFEEVLISPQTLSRYGQTSLDQTIALLQKCHELKCTPILEFDTFLHESQEQALFYIFDKLIKETGDLFLVKVCDLGVALKLAHEYSAVKLHLSLESSYHNWPSISALVIHPKIGPKVKRVILSLELSFLELKTISDELIKLKIESEFLGMGRILLFSTPRLLLSHQFPEIVSDSQYIEAEGSSEESPHRGFPLVQNGHGTFMFNTKDICLLDSSDRLIELSIGVLRFDFRFEQTEKKLKLYEWCRELLSTFNEDKFSDFKAFYQRPVTRGFFSVNKSDVLLPKLKNLRLQNRTSDLLGHIVDIDREEKKMAILLRYPEIKRKAPLFVRLVSPEGKEKKLTINFFEDENKQSFLETKEGDLILFVPYVSGISCQSLVFTCSDS